MNKSFISDSYYYGLLIFLGFLFLLGFYKTFIFFGIIVSSLIWLFRKRSAFYTYDTRDKLTLFSPVSGSVKNLLVNDEYNVLVLTVNFFDSYGVFLPYTSRLDDFEIAAGEQLFRWNLPKKLEEFDKKKINF